MRIEELVPNLNISLLVNVNSQQLTLESKILEVYPQKHLVLAEAVYRRDKVVTFRDNNVTVDLLVTLEDKPYIFKNIKVTLVKTDSNKLCYNLACDTEGKAFNRRQNFRCYVSIPSVLQCGSSKEGHVSLIRDVSVTGFSVICDENIPVSEGQLMHVVLKDYFEETDEKFNFHLYGIIVRTQDMENGSTLYGCRLNSYIPALESYIMKKERLRLKRTNGGNL